MDTKYPGWLDEIIQMDKKYPFWNNFKFEKSLILLNFARKMAFSA